MQRTLLFLISSSHTSVKSLTSAIGSVSLVNARFSSQVLDSKLQSVQRFQRYPSALKTVPNGSGHPQLGVRDI